MVNESVRTFAAPLGRFERGANQSRAVVAPAAPPADGEPRTVEVVFSSEALVDRGGFYEVLSHESRAIRSARLDAGLAVLVNHDESDHVGISVGWRLCEDRRCRAKLRFGESARASEINRDVETGIRPAISVRYRVHDFREETAPDGRPVFLVTDWEPMEISVASIPADTEAAVGRTADNPPAPPAARAKAMSDETKEPAAVDVRAVEDRTRRADLERVNEIMAIGERHGLTELTRKAIATGMTLDDFRVAALTEIGKVVPAPSAEIGLTPKEAGRYSFVRAINALANPQSRTAQDAAGFEFECSAAAAKVSQREPRGVMVPHDVLIHKRTMTVGTASAGGYLKATELRPESFIDILRARMMVAQMGATQLTGLVGDMAIPRKSASATGYWVAEDGAITASDLTLGQMPLAPKTVGGMVELSKKLLVQSTPDADAIVIDDLAGMLAATIDLATLHGSGTNNQPTGIIAQSGVGILYGGANGGALTYALLCGAEAAVAAANADGGNMGWITNAQIRRVARQIFTNATYGSEPLYTQSAMPGWGTMLGYRCGITSNVLSNIVRGTSGAVCSAAFLGDWAQAVQAFWTGLDLTVDPYSLSAKGGVRVVALQLVDVNVRQPGAFCVVSGITTA